MRAAVIRRAVAATGVLALVGGCTAQAAGSGGKDPSPAPSATASDDAKPSGSGSPGSTPAPAASSPTPAPKTLYAPGDKGKDVRELQARLRQVAWLFDGPTGTYDAATTAAVKGFQGKRGLPRTGTTDTVTWQRLLKMTHEPTRDELYAAGGQTPAKPDPRCMTGRVLCISKTSRTLSWMVDGKTQLSTDVRFGSQFTPTREGVFQVYWKSRHHVSTIYHTAMPYAMFFSGGQAVHYSSDFAARGYSGASHGCVNVRDEGKIATLFQQVKNGDKVVIYW
ncbi:L,D-transpeptidase family protein [Streptomyces sp. NPDC050095]|uniref:L,D-transpeptidase family protein n=1 Tax=unclassified Streptomyces TaxID=2593676 RepID=UPI00342AF5B0